MSLTKKEYEQLKMIPILYPWAKYIAMDCMGTWLYENKPKVMIYGIYINNQGKFENVDYKFKSIKEPGDMFNIDEALKNRSESE